MNYKLIALIFSIVISLFVIILGFCVPIWYKPLKLNHVVDREKQGKLTGILIFSGMGGAFLGFSSILTYWQSKH